MPRTPVAASDFLVREPAPEDGIRLHELVRRVPPLAENSIYCNLLQCSHFSHTCAVAEHDGELVAFVTGYLHPKRDHTYFLWQVGVAEAGRGCGLPLRMIQTILSRPACRQVRALEATVSATNTASQALFQALARAEGAECRVEAGHYPAGLFGPDNATPEDLFRVEPLTTPTSAG